MGTTYLRVYLFICIFFLFLIFVTKNCKVSNKAVKQKINKTSLHIHYMQQRITFLFPTENMLGVFNINYDRFFDRECCKNVE